MRRLSGAVVLPLAFARYLWESRRKGSGVPCRVPFHIHLLDRLESNNFPRHARPFAVGFTILSALPDDPAAVRRVFQRLPNDVPWDMMSPKLLRRIFEFGLLHSEAKIAAQARSAIEVAQGTAHALSNEAVLARWRFNQLTPEENARIDTSRQWILAYPFFDSYFKGTVTERAGRVTDALRHYGESLDTVPPEFPDLRQELLERRERLDQFKGLLAAIRVERF